MLSGLTVVRHHLKGAVVYNQIQTSLEEEGKTKKLTLSLMHNCTSRGEGQKLFDWCRKKKNSELLTRALYPP